MVLRQTEQQVNERSGIGMRRIIANLDMRTPLSKVAEVARAAERMGFDRLSIPDACHDGLTAAAIAANATSTIEIANSALVCFPRSPMTTAVAAWDLQELSQGRYRLGLGPLIAQNIVQKYSTTWSPPAPRMREYVASIRAIFRSWQHGEELQFIGEYYRFTRQQTFSAPGPIAYPDLRLQLAAVGPNMMGLAGEVADSVTLHPTNTSPLFIRENVLPELAVGAAKSGRAIDAVQIVANPFIAVGRTSEELNASREHYRLLLATVLSTPNYWRSLELIDREDVGPKLRELYRCGQIDMMARQIDERIMEAFVVSAAWEDLAERLRDYYDEMDVSLGINVGDCAEIERSMSRLIMELAA